MVFGGDRQRRRRREGIAERIELPSHIAYAHWNFPRPIASIAWDVTVRQDPGSDAGLYLALFNGRIDNSLCYLGLQTDVAFPATGQGIGKGLIFSTWSSFDPNDARVADDGFYELGTHEGRFIGVRKPFDWGVGTYRVTLARSHTHPGDDRVSDWFELTIAAVESAASFDTAVASPPVWVGGLRFIRRRADTPACIDPEALSFLEVYSGARTWADVPRWDVGVAAYGDGQRCTSGRTEYPAYPHGQRMPNVDVYYDDQLGEVRFSAGPTVEQVHPRAWWRADRA